MVELLAPAGNFDKLKTALHFGADAVYVAGKQFGLRAYADNFDDEQLLLATEYTHSLDKKIYVAVNIFAKNSDLDDLAEYLRYLEKIKVDAAIVTDVGVISTIKKNCPSLQIHLSTQANTTNYEAVNFWCEHGVERVVLARELSKDEIEIIHKKSPKIELEMFVHGAMCISYSGRCLLSNYLSTRDSNRGECVQACRWEYKIHEAKRADNPLNIEQDERGTYILNSKDLCLIEHIDDVVNTGVASLKIEGRMKSEYYVGAVVSAYRRAIDAFYSKSLTRKMKYELKLELEKTSHREYTTANFLGENSSSQCYHTSMPKQNYTFIAGVVSYDKKNKLLRVEMRNRFKTGDTLEILSNNKNCGKNLIIRNMYDESMNKIDDAFLVQQTVYIECEHELSQYDILTRENL